MLARVVHILPLTTIRRERLLPVPGQVIVHLNQKVTPFDVIAEANFGQEHILLEVAQTLGVSPGIADSLIQVKAGSPLTMRQCIAERRGLISKIIHSPVNGRVIEIRAGQVLIEVSNGKYELHASIPGTVTRLIQERGAEISTNGALVQAVWGNGRVDAGIMIPILSKPDDILAINRIDVSMRGSVLLAGHCNDPNLIQVAAELPVRGLILGSMASKLIPSVMKVRYPVLVIEGFGHLPMSNTAYRLLTTNSKREVTVNAEFYNQYTGVHPEVIIPLPVMEESPIPLYVGNFALEQNVRVCRAPYTGSVGVLVKLHQNPSTLPNGLRLVTGEVRLENGDRVVVPLVNLEVLG